MDTKTISNLGKYALNAMAQVKHYGWNPELCTDEIKRCYDKIMKHIKDNKLIDMKTLTKADAYELGFTKWEEEQPDFLLIPIWLYDAIPDGTEIYSFTGEKRIKGKDEIDLDVRFGCIAYGIKIHE
jgi:hypothetical protein